MTRLALLIAVVFALAAAGHAAKAQAAETKTAETNPLPGFWDKPLAFQGPPPEGWSEAERSLDPKDCGQCHPQQYEEWRSSFHAKAFSPGLIGQLMTSLSSSLGECMECHAPLAEQEQAFRLAQEAGMAHVPEQQGLAASGNGCAGCHIRNHQRHGPPKDGAKDGLGESGADLPHGGVSRSPYFEDSAFCNACHQFPPSWGAVNGKPLENTYEEWKASPQARKGMTCQTCHMPKRKHLWRGIHDPEMTASGLTASFAASQGKAIFTITNANTGHAFPTYVTPKAIMRAVRLDQAGQPIKGGEMYYVIQRSVSFTNSEWVEAFDTRLFPGQSAVLEVPFENAASVRMWLEVHPDDFYDHMVYDGLLKNLSGEARKLIAQADENAAKSRFILFETELHPQP